MVAACSVSECELPAKSRGMCRPHYIRWWTYGDARAHVPLKPRVPKPVSHCIVDGCEKKQWAYGLCSAHYTRQRRNGSPHISRKIANGSRERFLRHLVGHRGNECVEWPFCRDSKGYGYGSVDGKQMIASRAMCIIAHGEPPEAHYHAAHSCGNGHLGCVNPNHLRWATHSENMQDKKLHGSHNAGEFHQQGILTEKQVLLIRFLRRVVPGRELARRFGVHYATVSAVQRRRIWTWLSDFVSLPPVVNLFRCDEVTGIG